MRDVHRAQVLTLQTVLLVKRTTGGEHQQLAQLQIVQLENSRTTVDGFVLTAMETARSASELLQQSAQSVMTTSGSWETIVAPVVQMESTRTTQFGLALIVIQLVQFVMDPATRTAHSAHRTIGLEMYRSAHLLLVQVIAPQITQLGIVIHAIQHVWFAQEILTLSAQYVVLDTV